MKLVVGLAMDTVEPRTLHCIAVSSIPSTISYEEHTFVHIQNHTKKSYLSDIFHLLPLGVKHRSHSMWQNFLISNMAYRMIAWEEAEATARRGRVYSCTQRPQYKNRRNDEACTRKERVCTWAEGAEKQPQLQMEGSLKHIRKEQERAKHGHRSCTRGVSTERSDRIELESLFELRSKL
jgi:hypothetical protein